MASSLPNQFYTDFTFSGTETNSSQFHGSSSSSCPDVSSYLDDCYNASFNASYNPDSAFLPQLFGVSDVSMLEYNNYYQRMSVNDATQYFHGGDQECYGFSQDIKPMFPPSIGEQTWANNDQGGTQANEPNTKVGRYSVEERKDRIMRYLKKKNQRNFNKTIKYVCRKTLADRRVRVRGRFARNNDTCEQQSPMSSSSKNHNNHSDQKDEDMFSGSDDYLIQMENDEGWLHEAMSNLISFPCELEAPGDVHHSNTWSF